MSDERRRDRMRSFTHDFPPDKIWEANTVTKGEMTMSERLTKEIVQDHFKYGTVSELYALIESDREAIRSEVMKGRYAIGERVQVKDRNGKWAPGIVTAAKAGSLVENWTSLSFQVRRPPKTRPMTRRELTQSILNANTDYCQFSERYLDSFSNEKLEEFARLLTVPTEVEE